MSPTVARHATPAVATTTQFHNRRRIGWQSQGGRDTFDGDLVEFILAGDCRLANRIGQDRSAGMAASQIFHPLMMI